MPSLARAPRRSFAALLVAILIAAISPATAGAAPTFKLDLGVRGDFVAQTNFVQCVGASMQMMINMAEPGRDRSAKTQLRLQKLARANSGPRPDGTTRQGASVHGWSAGLNTLGVGPYRVVGLETLQAALKTAARAMRETGRPVGLLVWRGRHAWVMSGFKSTADPMVSDDFKVTAAIVEDPLYPHGSSVWGPSPKPGEALTPAELGKQFVPRRSSARWAGVNPLSKALAGKYVLVLPYPQDYVPAGLRIL
jgi:hypothetical protein